MSRLDLLSLIENIGKQGLGLSITARAACDIMFWRSRDSDYQADRICAVWDRVSGTPEQINLCSRAINETERGLEVRGIIARTTGGNGARPRSERRSYPLCGWHQP